MLCWWYTYSTGTRFGHGSTSRHLLASRLYKYKKIKWVGTFFCHADFLNISSQDFFLTPLPLTPEGDFARDFLVRITKKYFQEIWSWRVNKEKRGLKKSRCKILKTRRRDWLDFQLWVKRWGHMFSPSRSYWRRQIQSHTTIEAEETKKRHIKTQNDRDRQKHSSKKTPTHTQK